MKCISIRQPWVHSIFYLGKDIENRDWPTRYRGRIAIHASKGCTSKELSSANFSISGIIGINCPTLPSLDPNYYPRGVIIGTAEIVDCVSTHSSPWFFGSYGFVLANKVLLPNPIPWRGQLGIFDIPDHLFP